MRLLASRDTGNKKTQFVLTCPMFLCLCFLLFFCPVTLQTLFLSVCVLQEQTQVIDPPSTQHVPVNQEPPRSLSQNSLRRCKNTQETLSFPLSYSLSPIHTHTKTHTHTHRKHSWALFWHDGPHSLTAETNPAQYVPVLQLPLVKPSHQ